MGGLKAQKICFIGKIDHMGKYTFQFLSGFE